MRKEVFDLVGCDRRAGFKRQDFEEEIVQVVTRGPDGELVSLESLSLLLY